MKSIILFSLIFGSFSARASDIWCQNPTFSILIKKLDQNPLPSFNESTFPSSITFSTTGAQQLVKGTLKVHDIYTRLDVGTSFYVDLGHGSNIDLRDIHFHPYGKTGFTGVFTQAGQSYPLKCGYLN